MAPNHHMRPYSNRLGFKNRKVTLLFRGKRTADRAGDRLKWGVIYRGKLTSYMSHLLKK